jgi:hypothetical protein
MILHYYDVDGKLSSTSDAKPFPMRILFGKIELTGSNPLQHTAVIATGVSLSLAVDLGKETLLGYIMPASPNWTAADITFQSSPDDIVPYSDIYDNTGTEISHSVAAGRFVRVNPAEWIGVRFVKFRSGTAAAPVNQVAARSIILISKAV